VSLGVLCTDLQRWLCLIAPVLAQGSRCSPAKPCAFSAQLVQVWPFFDEMYPISPTRFHSLNARSARQDPVGFFGVWTESTSKSVMPLRRIFVFSWRVLLSEARPAGGREGEPPQSAAQRVLSTPIRSLSGLLPRRLRLRSSKSLLAAPSDPRSLGVFCRQD